LFPTPFDFSTGEVEPSFEAMDSEAIEVAVAATSLADDGRILAPPTGPGGPGALRA
jgi:hypothetical protein